MPNILFNNGITPNITKVLMMNQFDMAYVMGGSVWMFLYWPIIFINFLIVVKLIEYGMLNNFSDDMIFFMVTSGIFLIPMTTIFGISCLHRGGVI